MYEMHNAQSINISAVCRVFFYTDLMNKTELNWTSIAAEVAMAYTGHSVGSKPLQIYVTDDWDSGSVGDYEFKIQEIEKESHQHSREINDLEGWLGANKEIVLDNNELATIGGSTSFNPSQHLNLLNIVRIKLPNHFIDENNKNDMRPRIERDKSCNSCLPASA